MQKATAYRIETERMIIRCYKPEDAITLNQTVKLNMSHLLPWMPWVKAECDSIEQKIERIRKFRGEFDLGHDYLYGIFDKTDQKMIGSIGLHTRPEGDAREIGYWISVENINKGFATEAVSALTRVGFDVALLSRIEIHCSTDNIRSITIPKKNHYTLEAVLKNRISDAHGNVNDKMIWTLFNSDYQKIKDRFAPVKVFDMIGREINLTDCFLQYDFSNSTGIR